MRRLVQLLLLRRVLAFALLVGLLWVVAANGIGMRLLVPWALDRFAPPEWTVTVGSVEGDWRSSINVRELSVASPGLTATVDEATVDYRLLPLVRRTVRIERLAVGSVDAQIDATIERDEAEPAPGEEGSWVRLLRGSPLGAWTVDLGLLSVQELDADVETSEGRYAVRQATVAGELRLGPSGLGFAVDSLTAAIDAPTADGASGVQPPPGDLRVAATLEDGTLSVSALSFRSQRSDLTGGGVARLAPSATPVEEVDFTLAAAPLDLRDLPIEWPDPVRAHPLVTLDATARGVADSVVVTATAEALDGLSARLEAVVSAPFGGRPTEDGRPAARGSVEMSGLELAPWSGPPFDGVVDGRLDATLSDLSASGIAEMRGSVTHRHGPTRVAGLAGRDARLDFTATRDGATTPPRLEAESRIHLAEPSRSWEEVGVVSATVTGSAARWRADLALDGGSLRGAGDAAWGDSLAVGIERLTARALDLSLVRPDLPTSSLRGAMRGRLSGAELRTLRGDVRLDLGPSTVAETSVDTVAVTVRVDAGRFDGRVLAADSAARVALRYRGELAPPGAAADGTDSIALDGTLNVTVDSATSGALRITEGDVTVTRRGERVLAALGLRLTGVGVTPITVRAEAELTGSTADDLTGTADFVASRPRPTAQDAGGDTDVPDARPEAIDSIVVSVSAETPRRLEATGFLHPADGGRLRLEGTADLDEASTSFDVRAVGALPSMELVGDGPVSVDTVRITARGARTEDGWEELIGDVNLVGVGWQGVVADTALARFSLDGAALRLDTLHIRSNVLTAWGRGTLPEAGATTTDSITVHATLVDLEPIRRLTGAEVFGAGSAELHTTVAGTLADMTVQADGRVNAVLAGEVRLTGLDVDGTARVLRPLEGPLDIREGRLELTLDRLILPDTEVRAIDIAVTGDPDSLVLEAEADVDDRRRADLVVHVDPRPGYRLASVERLDLQLDRDTWSLASPATFSYLDGWALRSFALRASEQEIRIDGSVTESGALDLDVRMDSTDIGTVSDLVGLPGLRGWIGGELVLSGTTSEPTGRIDVNGAFHRQGARPGPVSIVAELDSGRIVTDLDLENPSGGRLRVDGSARLPARAAPGSDGNGDRPALDALDLAVVADDFRLTWALPFFDPGVVSDLDGRLGGEIAVAGSVQEPDLTGSLVLRGGRGRLPGLGLLLEDAVVFAGTSGAELVIDSARVVSGTGTLRANGTVTLQPDIPLDLALRLDGFQAIRNESYRSTVSGELSLAGTLVRPEVNGDLQVQRLDVYLDDRITDDGLEEVELTEEDLRALRERFGYIPSEEDTPPPLFERLTADLSVDLGRDSWLRKRASPEMAVAFTGNLAVRLRPGEAPDLQGSVETIEGRGFVEQFGRRFTLREGTVTFDGPPTETRVDLSAVYTVPSRDNPRDAEATIILDIEGSQDELSLTLSSEPPMENADIVSYIATGRPAAGSLSFSDSEEGGGLVSAGADLALGQLVGVVESAAAQSAGLDVIEIRREGLREVTLVAGKYFSPRLYIGFAYPVSLREGDRLSGAGSDETEVEVELEALRWLLVNIEGSGSALRLFLRGRYAY